MAHSMGFIRQILDGQRLPGADPIGTLASQLAAEALLKSVARQAIIAAAVNAMAELSPAGGVSLPTASPGIPVTTSTRNTSPGGPIDVDPEKKEGGNPTGP